VSRAERDKLFWFVRKGQAAQAEVDRILEAHREKEGKPEADPEAAPPTKGAA
jgi:hypothetical protein